jgi:hypothetical protein
MTAHIFTQISILIEAVLCVFNIDPWEDRILSDVVIVSACDFIKPLKVLIVGDLLIYPSKGFI